MPVRSVIGSKDILHGVYIIGVKAITKLLDP
jgi:hypothetical protein